MQIGNHILKNNLVVAPMAGVTDRPFRQLCKKMGAGLAVSEMVTSNSLLYGSEKTKRRANHEGEVDPISVQIAGADPKMMAEAAKHNVDNGAQIIDINMGCPAKDVVKIGSGSGLIRNPERAAELIAAAKEGGLPVSVKTRLGDVRTDEWTDWLTHILKQDVANLTIHLRTRKEMSKVPAHYELIHDIKKLRDEIAPHTKLTINR